MGQATYFRGVAVQPQDDGPIDFAELLLDTEALLLWKKLTVHVDGEITIPYEM
jgi:hypothetical protein